MPAKTETAAEFPVRTRPTGIDTLDNMLQGGFPSDSTVLVSGESGTGKTVLTMQWLFEGLHKHRENGLYITLTEPVNKAIRNVQRFDFHTDGDISRTGVHVEDLRNIMSALKLDTKKLTLKDIDKIVEALADLVMELKATRVVIDSISAIAYRLNDKDLLRNFIYHLDALLTPLDVNVIMISEVERGIGYSTFGIEEFISDGIIKVSRKNDRGRLHRRLQIVKMRGVDFDSSIVPYKITQAGIHLYPVYKRELNYDVSSERVSTGVALLDKMTDGGFFKGSSVLYTGSSGSGKTNLALQALVSTLDSGQKAIYFSYEESKSQIFRNAKSFGWDLESYEKQGLLELNFAYPEEKYIKEHLYLITEKVEKFEPSLVVVDSLSALSNVAGKEQVRKFATFLNTHMKEKLVTVLFTNATDSLIGASSITDSHLSTVMDQIIMLRYTEIQAELRHALLILKMRGSSHDKKLVEIKFTDNGIVLGTEFGGYEGLLSGVSKKVSKSQEERLQELFSEHLGPMGAVLLDQEVEKGISHSELEKTIQALTKDGILNKDKEAKFLASLKNIFKDND